MLRQDFMRESMMAVRTSSCQNSIYGHLKLYILEKVFFLIFINFNKFTWLKEIGYITMADRIIIFNR
ncbi:hypothetical protein RhiirA4_150537 [Rhizophagus irregularis]|uniref:Uncharacterized protein n=1 Tax=Rhizophagus irregularis TaxID=588596 RepID=A0A2I1GDB8_9GLOM|nr:hypothetical protein RhiirA4_150537 [Rhizophagus irregularis]